MKINFFIFISLFLSLFNNFSFAVSQTGDIFNQGCSFYEEGNYLQAINAYESVIKKGVENPTIYYNLGNAYFKNQQLGKALVHYERAFRLSPRNEDIRFNLTFARLKATKEKTPGIFKKIFFNIYNLLNINELTLFTSFFYFSLCILIAVYIFKKKHLLLWLMIPVGFLIVFSGSWLGIKIYNEKITTSAIVIVPCGEVRNGPSTDYSIGFTLPEGEKVIVLQQKDSWYAVGIKEKGLKGWINKESIEKI